MGKDTTVSFGIINLTVYLCLMTGIDLILGGILLYGLIKGLWKGLFIELASLVSLLLGIYLAIKFSGVIGNMFDSQLPDDPKNAAIIAFIITFLAVVIGITLLAKVFTKIADFSGLGLLNRLLGGFFGLLKTALILSVALNFFLRINTGNTIAKKETLDGSTFFYPLLQMSDLIFPVLEDWFRDDEAAA